MSKEYQEYKRGLIKRFWEYQRSCFPNCSTFFERDFASDNSPPVFKKCQADFNVLVVPDCTEEERQEVLRSMPSAQRHRWFRSMTSSQALAQSVFGNLKALGKLELLSDIQGNDGRPLLLRSPASKAEVRMEHPVTWLGEPRPTSVDVLFDGDYRVAVECKLTEPKVGWCSRPDLKEQEAKYDSEYCDGRYCAQRGRDHRCPLTAVGGKYWKHIPLVLDWSVDEDHDPCPLRKTYQLVRNVLAACVRSDGSLDIDGGHAVLLYDQRNPAFQSGGSGWGSLERVRGALRRPSMLQLCTWQHLLGYLQKDSGLRWLVEALDQKYGLRA